MIIIDNSKYEEALKAAGADINDIRIPLSVDIFERSRAIFKHHPYAIATHNGGDVAVLRDDPSSYLHFYEYGGIIDTEFLNRFEVLFLHGCNEYSVELIRRALDKWIGTTLVLVGEDWQYLVELLPDLPGIECVWQDDLLKDFYDQATAGKSFLHVTCGMPAEESMDRYNNHILSYDEIMAFTFMFANKKSFGSENPDRNFFVVDANYGNLGLFAIFTKAVCIARYAKKKGFIPVMRIKNEYGKINLYQDFIGDEIWGKFYEQPEGYSYSDISKSANVFIPPFFYNARILQTLMDEYSEDVTLAWPDGIFNSNINGYLDSKEKEFLPYPDKTLGVIARGTDYIGTRLHNHAKHATKEMLADKIEELLVNWNLEYVFIATEDENYHAYFKDRFKDKVFMTDQERYSTAQGEMLAQMYRNRAKHSDGFRRGADYILAVHLLSRCDSLLASGGCMALGESRKMRSTSFSNEYVFDLGLN